MQKRLHFLIAMLMFFTSGVMAQLTTSGITGKVTSQGEDVIGATVTAVHQPSGTLYRAVTNIDGRYTIQGMRVGGPYKVEITYVGHQPKVFNGVTLNLGETRNISCSIEEDSKELQEIVVTGRAGLNQNRCGYEHECPTDKRHAEYHSWYCRCRTFESAVDNHQFGSDVICRYQ